MKFLINKIYIISLLLIIFLIEPTAFAKDKKIQYSSKNISNYFSGIVSVSKNYNNRAFKHLKKVQLLKNRHSQFNIEFIRTLVLIEKFDEAFAFSKNVWTEEEFFFEADLLLGLNFLIKEDYINAEKHFERLNKISKYNLFFKDFMGNVLIAWSKAAQNDKEDSFKYLEKIPNSYNQLTKIQNIFLQCYFDSKETNKLFEELIQSEDYNFSRYNFFLTNYLLHKNKTIEAKKTIQNARKKYNSNLLIKQAENFLYKENKEIKNFFDCKNPKDSLAEFLDMVKK